MFKDTHFEETSIARLNLLYDRKHPRTQNREMSIIRNRNVRV
ncbi:hypothetical protein H1P_1550005 [Hyella patelloides LEGE 07179]|uniref:Uncharacterized protein n=1 Tax=Hyella patelloides LEGE 07179 TaxID=945734 RepID=A0A563VMB0_9CYAN|nr:hypothetical protein H1P_1550005 [Hyella patelloides LEGE 07179]